MRCPLLVIHGTQDEVIGFWHGRRLFELANQPKQFYAVERAGHNDVDFVGGRNYLNAIQAFAASLEPREGIIGEAK